MEMRQGFSLIELSIVLVILGLLIGGILAGKSLIHASELRGAVTDANNYRTAVNSFRDRYFALPGDISNATSIWGTAADCSSASQAPMVGTATCNGNGNNSIQWGYPNIPHGEIFIVWQHLVNAGLVSGSFTGVQGPGTFQASSVGGLNSPLIELNNGCVGLHSIGSSPGGMIPPANVMNPAGTSGNVLLLGRTTGSNPDYCYGAEFTPEDAWNIDTKMDDGTASNGKVFAWVRANCTNNTTPGSGDYLLTYTSTICALVMRLDM